MKQRYDEHGDTGLSDQSWAPRNSPNAMAPEVVSKILYLLRQSYHFGPRKIADYLKRFHSVSVAGATVHRILIKHGVNRLPANQKVPSACEALEALREAAARAPAADGREVSRAHPGNAEAPVSIHGHRRLKPIRVLKIYDACTQANAIRFADEVIRRLPFRILVIQTDNGAEFQSKFQGHLEELDIRHVYIKPRTPRLNGKVERSHRVDNQEFYQLLDKGGVSDDIQLFNEKLREWENYYNYHRPHSRSEWTNAV